MRQASERVPGRPNTVRDIRRATQHHHSAEKIAALIESAARRNRRASVVMKRDPLQRNPMEGL
jgi:hypothetical protein